MKNKGFTLVELLSIIVLLGIISLIVYPTITKSLEKARNNAYNTQIAEIKTMAKNWATKNMDKLDEYHLNNTYITFSVLKNEGYMRKGNVDNPNTKEKMVGCIEIAYNTDNNSYSYELEEVDNKISEENACDGKIGYIYTYENNTIKENKENISTLAYDEIYKSNVIKAVGDTDDGLYDIENDYIFKGVNINNNVNFGGEKWRIVSLNKENKTIKLIKETSIGDNVWDNNNNIQYQNSTVKTDKLDILFDTTSSSVNKKSDKIKKDAIYNVGLVDTVDNYDTIISKETSETINYKIGLINISDYMAASTTCSDYNDNCKENNYIFNLFSGKSAWTINNNGSGIWNINADGAVVNSSPNELKSYFPVIILNSNITIKEGIGTSTSPYVIE